MAIDRENNGEHEVIVPLKYSALYAYGARLEFQKTKEDVLTPKIHNGNFERLCAYFFKYPVAMMQLITILSDHDKGCDLLCRLPKGADGSNDPKNTDAWFDRQNSARVRREESTVLLDENKESPSPYRFRHFSNVRHIDFILSVIEKMVATGQTPLPAEKLNVEMKNEWDQSLYSLTFTGRPTMVYLPTDVENDVKFQNDPTNPI